MEVGRITFKLSARGEIQNVLRGPFSLKLANGTQLGTAFLVNGELNFHTDLGLGAGDRGTVVLYVNEVLPVNAVTGEIIAIEVDEEGVKATGQNSGATVFAEDLPLNTIVRVQ